jgi:hypothetical protein
VSSADAPRESDRREVTPMKPRLFAACVVTCSAAPAFAQQWMEQGDARDTPEFAQRCEGAGPLASITGAVTSTDADMYAFQIVDFANFSASTVGTTTMDTQLFMFDSTGHGVSSNDDEVGSSAFQSRITSQFVTANGLYYLAITGFDRDPQTGAGQLIWVSTPHRSERRPDGPGASGVVGRWGGTGSAGTYTITLTGAALLSPTCPVDFDGNGVVNLQDFLGFLQAFAAGAPSADFDGSGLVNVQDFLGFLQAFAQGC